MFTLGFMQYTTPTAHFLLAVFVFGEHFTRAHAVAFAAIWAGVGLFAVDLALEQRRRTRA
jgi:chloramphenicol-sensitive protein RarD